MSIEQREKILKLSKEFLRRDLNNAVLYCLKFMENADKIFAAMEPQDFVLIVIEKFNDGIRRCDTESYKHFKWSFFYAIKSELKNYYRLNRHEKGKENLDEVKKVYENDEEETKYTPECIVDGIEEVFSYLNSIEIKEILIKILKDDEKGKLIISEILNGANGNKEIAEALGINVREVENGRKRIYRAISKRFREDFIAGRKK